MQPGHPLRQAGKQHYPATQRLDIAQPLQAIAAAFIMAGWILAVQMLDLLNPHMARCRSPAMAAGVALVLRVNFDTRITSALETCIWEIAWSARRIASKSGSVVLSSHVLR